MPLYYRLLSNYLFEANQVAHRLWYYFQLNQLIYVPFLGGNVHTGCVYLPCILFFHSWTNLTCPTKWASAPSCKPNIDRLCALIWSCKWKPFFKIIAWVILAGFCCYCTIISFSTYMMMMKWRWINMMMKSRHLFNFHSLSIHFFLIPIFFNG